MAPPRGSLSSRLREVLTPYTVSHTRDAATGEETAAAAAGDPVRARVRPLRVQEAVRAGRDATREQIEVTLRYNAAPALTHSDYFDWGGQHYHLVTEPINVEARDRLVMALAEKNDA